MCTPSTVARFRLLVFALTSLVLAPASMVRADGSPHRILDSNDGPIGTAPRLRTYAAPLARLALSQSTSPPLTVIADASSSEDTSGVGIGSLRFDFGDSTPVVTTNAQVMIVQHTYAAPGHYTVALTVTNIGEHASGSTSGEIDVQPPDFPPVAALTLTQLATPALTVRADASGSTDTDVTPIASYRFDFGDTTPVVVTTAPTATADHSYATAGPHTVTVIVTDTGNHASSPLSAGINVAPPDYPPIAVLSVTQLASPALTVMADASGSTDTDATPISTFEFDFGDSTAEVTTTAGFPTAQHTYAAPGHYTVLLNAIDTGGLMSTTVSASVNVLAPDDPPVAALAVTQIASPALTVRADASGSTDTDATPIARYQFDFGDGTPVDTTAAPTAIAQHTYATAGHYTVTLTVTDTGNHTSSPIAAGIDVVATVVLEVRVAGSSEDAEEFSDATVHLTSSDLELIHDSTDQIVGMRWFGVSIPAGALVSSAYIQFGAKEAQSVATQLTLRAQASDNAATFTTLNGNVSSRPRTVASASWAPVPWNAGEVGANQRTPDLSALIQEVVGRSGWASGHSLAVIVNGTGHRTAWAYDGSPTLAPLLHVAYVPVTLPEQPPVARLTAAQVASPPLTVYADASGSTDGDSTPIASYRFDFGDGTPVVVTTAPTSTALHTYSTAGNYTVTLTATDTGSLTSAPVTAGVLVSNQPPPQIAVYAGYYDTHHAVNPKPKPDPWLGSPNTVFVGQPDNQPGDPPDGAWDTSCMRVDNLTSGTLNNVVVTVDVGARHFALWGTHSIPPGYHLIMAQTVYQNFDVPDFYPAGCYGCDTSLCVTERSSDVPLIHVSIGGAHADYPDTGQTINTDGYDAAGCPYVGGPLPLTRYDESRQWVRVWPPVGGGLRASPAVSPEVAMPPISNAVPRVVALSPVTPNPVRSDFAVRFTTARSGPVHVGLYDISGRLVKPWMDSVLEPGEYSLRGDLSRLAPGMYFIRLWTPEASRIEKLVRLN